MRWSDLAVLGLTAAVVLAPRLGLTAAAPQQPLPPLEPIAGSTRALDATLLQPASQPAADAAGTAATAVAPAAPRWAFDWGLELALRIDAFVTQGRTFAVDVASGQNEGIHGINYAVDVELAYAPPLPADWRLVSIAIGVGYTPFFGTGFASFSQYATSGDSYQLLVQRYQYDWAVHLIPINAGLRLGLPLARFGLSLPIRVEVEGGFAGGFAMASSTLTVDGADQPFAKSVGSSDFGLGYYLGALVDYPIAAGLGSVVGGYRYSAVRLDFHRPDFNATWGDLGGHHLMVGYRLEL